jgi:hypothetical protein
MSDPATKQWWSTRKLPSGEVVLTVKSAAGRTFRWTVGFVAFGVMAMGGLVYMDEHPLPVVWAASGVLGLGLLAWAQVKGQGEVWRLKPGMATRPGGRTGEMAFFVSEVRLESAVDPEGDRSTTLLLVTPGKNIKVGPPMQRELSLLEMGRAMAEALAVELVQIER